MVAQSPALVQSNMAKTQIVTPLMELRWAKVFEPEEPQEEGKSRRWTVEGFMREDHPALLDFITRLETEFQTVNGAGAKPGPDAWPFGEYIEKKDGVPTGNPTGLFRFKFTRNETSFKGNILSPPVIVDAKRMAWPAETLIGNGSKGKIAFEPIGWDSRKARGTKGMSLWLTMLQVVELVPYERVKPEDVFEEEEGTSFGPETPFADEAPAAAPAPMSAAERLRQRAAQVANEAPGLDDSEVPF